MDRQVDRFQQVSPAQPAGCIHASRVFPPRPGVSCFSSRPSPAAGAASPPWAPGRRRESGKGRRRKRCSSSSSCSRSGGGGCGRASHWAAGGQAGFAVARRSRAPGPPAGQNGGASSWTFALAAAQDQDRADTGGGCPIGLRAGCDGCGEETASRLSRSSVGERAPGQGASGADRGRGAGPGPSRQARRGSKRACRATGCGSGPCWPLELRAPPGSGPPGWLVSLGSGGVLEARRSRLIYRPRRVGTPWRPVVELPGTDRALCPVLGYPAPRPGRAVNPPDFGNRGGQAGRSLSPAA